MSYAVNERSDESMLGWKAMLWLALLFGVIGIYAIPELLGATSGTEPAVIMARVVGGGAALLLGASAAGMLVRGKTVDRREFDGMASLTELRLSEAPPTTHSAPTQFDNNANDQTDTVLSDEGLPVIPQVRVARKEWALDLIQSLEWRRFEQLCVSYYRSKDMPHVAIPLAANGGMDIYLFQDAEHPRRATAVVHVRTRGPLATGVQGVRELLGIMAHERIERAFFMTNGVFTPEAKVLGHHHKIVLVDARVLLAMIQRLPEERQQALLEEATMGDYESPTCPMCGSKMVHASGSHGDYWGCATYPKCQWITPMVPKASSQ